MPGDAAEINLPVLVIEWSLELIHFWKLKPPLKVSDSGEFVFDLEG